MKLRGGIKFVLFVGALLGAWFGGNWAYVKFFILPLSFPPLEPGEVTLFGVQLTNERIIVSNGIAHLVQGSNEGFGAPTPQTEPTSQTGGKRIPIGALVETLTGNTESATELVNVLNGFDTQNIPPEEIVWDSSDVISAIKSDEKLRSKLESDLNTKLDGGPVAQIRKSRFETGIFIRVQVPLRYQTQAGDKQVSAEVLIPFRTTLASRVANHRLIKNQFDPSNTTYLSVYEEVISEMERSNTKQNVADALLNLLSERYLEKLARPAENLISRTTILVSDPLIRSASSGEVLSADGHNVKYNLHLHLHEEGRKRLWQYTAKNPNCQLLLVVKGMAIAAPIVKGQMKYATASITNIAEKELAQMAVDAIESKNIRAERK